MLQVGLLLGNSAVRVISLSVKVLIELLSLCVCILSHLFNFVMLAKLAEVSLLLEELAMVMPTVETMLVSYIV